MSGKEDNRRIINNGAFRLVLERRGYRWEIVQEESTVWPAPLGRCHPRAVLAVRRKDLVKANRTKPPRVRRYLLELYPDC